ncbi:hypothetical protein BB561_003175 [Smittium simulii]|uniref:Uncharacterized protein n=1 Tax=Smittium simulii TaxID=133385 RepID=A0A2T9YMK2_9FUNG|nr:hypothetical protein BB561_003175 [Smittium simulii]
MYKPHINLNRAPPSILKTVTQPNFKTIISNKNKTLNKTRIEHICTPNNAYSTGLITSKYCHKESCQKLSDLQNGKVFYSTDIFSQTISKNKSEEYESETNIKTDLWKLGLSDIWVTQEVYEKTIRKDFVEYSKLCSIFQEYISINQGEANSSLDEWYAQVFSVCNKEPKFILLLAELLFKAKEDKSLALDLYLCAAKFGDKDALYIHSTVRYFGAGGVKKETENSIINLEKLAESGHSHAQLSLASIYIKENRCNLQEKIIELLTRASEAGLSAANLKLGEYYKQNINIPKNYKIANFYLEKAIKDGSAEAQFLLGDMLSKGQNTLDGKPDYSTAFKMFEQAASKGVVEAQYNVGVYYINALGTKQSIENAIEYWEMATMQGFPMAAFNLGKLYLEGFIDVVLLPSEKPPQTILKISPDMLKAKGYLVAAKNLGRGSFIEQQADSLLQKYFIDTTNGGIKQPSNLKPKTDKSGMCSIM